MMNGVKGTVEFVKVVADLVTGSGYVSVHDHNVIKPALWIHIMTFRPSHQKEYVCKKIQLCPFIVLNNDFTGRAAFKFINTIPSTFV